MILLYLGIEYSEHSSYDELKRFTRYIRPKEIISTVPVNGKDLSKTAQIPHSWYKYDLKEKRNAYQKSITNFVKVTPLPPNVPLLNKPTLHIPFNYLNNSNKHTINNIILIDNENSENNVSFISEKSAENSEFHYDTADTDWMS